jgi:predicted aspartyl protease
MMTAVVMGALASFVPADAGVPLSSAGDGHDTVPVFVDGTGPFDFILDTGADRGAIYPRFAAKAHLKPLPGRDEVIGGQTGSSRLPKYRLGDVVLDGHHLRGSTVFGLPARRDAGREAGVLGNDFMDGALVAFDFPCRRVEVYDAARDVGRAIGKGPSPIKTGAKEQILTLPVAVNGAAGIAYLDTGSRKTRLTTSFARAARIDLASAAFRDAPPIYGTALHKMTPRSGPIGTVAFGGFTVSNVEAEVIDLPALIEDFKGRPAMILGADLLGRFRLLYDHKAHRIWLRTSECRKS